MKQFFTILLTLKIIVANAQSVEICNWKDNKKAALVLTFDDWLPGHEKIVVPELIKRKIPATFFVTTQASKWNTNAFKIMRFAQENGCEIANHTLTHPDLTAIDFKQAKKEINDARKLIMDSVPGAQCLTFAYPMGTKNPELIAEIQKQHLAARSVSQFTESNILYDFAKTEDDYYKINTVRMWRIVSPEKYSSWLNHAAAGGGLITFMFHSIYNDTIAQGWDPLHENYLKEIIDSTAAHANDLWICTFSDAVKYHRQKKMARVHFENKGSKLLGFTVALPNQKTFEYIPLSIKIEVKNGIESIEQNGIKVFYQLIENSKFALINIVDFHNPVKIYYR